MVYEVRGDTLMTGNCGIKNGSASSRTRFAEAYDEGDRGNGPGTAGMALVESGQSPGAAVNDVVVQVHASGFTWDELTWPLG